jgi:hypothetical protein
VRGRARRVLIELSKIGHDLGKLFESQNMIDTTPSSNPDDHVTTMFEVRDSLAAMLLCHYAMYCIVVHRILLSLLRGTANEQKEFEELEVEIQVQCHCVWKLINYSLCHRPLGLPIMSSALLFKYECAKQPLMQRYILAVMNELDAPKMGNRSWTGEQVSYAAGTFLGEGLPTP